MIAFGTLKEEVKQYAKLIPPGLVLDLGCGVGENARHLAKSHRVHAVDNHTFALDTLLKNDCSNITAICEDIATFPFKFSYSGIVCTHVLHFLARDALDRVLADIKSHTKPDGINIISAFTNKGDFKPSPSLLEPNALKEFYAGWGIIHYSETPRVCVATDGHGKHLVQDIAVLVARAK